MKRKPKDNGYDYKKAGDHVEIKPIKRGKKQLRNAAILKTLSLIHWDLVVAEGPRVVLTALWHAREHGLYWYALTPKGDGGLVDYCEFVVAAANHVKVINDVEWKLWFSNPPDDPRLIEFKRGFLEAKKEAEKAKREKKKGKP